MENLSYGELWKQAFSFFLRYTSFTYKGSVTIFVYSDPVSLVPCISLTSWKNDFIFLVWDHSCPVWISYHIIREKTPDQSPLFMQFRVHSGQHQKGTLAHGQYSLWVMLLIQSQGEKYRYKRTHYVYAPQCGLAYVFCGFFCECLQGPPYFKLTSC